MIDPDSLDWDKGDGLLPAIIQDADEKHVLMLGYMNRDALMQTQESGQVTFFSRSKQRLWTKGETSGNTLSVIGIEADCDHDTLLIMARPEGPVCHTGTQTCFGDREVGTLAFLSQLTQIIKDRKSEGDIEGSYTAKLFVEGAGRIAQKVGEEGVELSLAHVKGDTEEIKNEAADLLFHMMVMLEDADLDIYNVCDILAQRHR